MATKAQRIILIRIRCVERRRIVLRQKPEVLAAVRDMAAAAILLGHRAVQKLLVFELVGERRQSLVLAYPLRLVVASHAEAHRILLQKEFRRRSMRSMAFRAPVDIADDSMLILRVLRNLLYVLVACIAKERSNGYLCGPIRKGNDEIPRF